LQLSFFLRFNHF